MYIKRLLSSFIFFAYACLAHAQSLTTSLVVTGSTNALTFNAAVAPTGEFLSNGSKLWMAIIQGQQVYFFNDTAGFVSYPGGLGVLLSGQPAEAPAVRTITKSTEVIYLPSWNTRSILGSDVYVGYGSSFADLVKNARYKKLYTFVEKQPDGLEALFGRLTLNYKFRSSSTIYTDVVDFSAANINTSGSEPAVTAYVVGDPARGVACGPFTQPFRYTHACAIYDSTYKTSELFGFTLSAGSLSGVYTYCSSSVSNSACSSELLNNPDGTVTGTLVSKATPASLSITPVIDRSTEHAKSQLDVAAAIDSGVLKQSVLLSTEVAAGIDALIKQSKGSGN